MLEVFQETNMSFFEILTHLISGAFRLSGSDSLTALPALG
jgi:hypothetical protein